ncbi:MAG: DNA-binding protein [Gemmataceae bacterium]
MTTFSIPLSNKRASQLLLQADTAGLTPEEFLRIYIEEFLDRQEEAFRGAVAHVLTKNAELYRRLA